MVDLVKLRKKAKKAAEKAEQAQELEPSAPPAVPETDAPPPVAEDRSSAVDSTPVAAVPSTRAAGAPEVDPVAPSQKRTPAAAPASAPAPTPASTPETSSKLERFKEEAGKRRDAAVQLGAREGEQQDELLELLAFVIAGEHYAVDIERIVEIVTPRSLTRVPNADNRVVGIISLRGTIVTLLDVRSRLRHAASVQTPDTRVIVLDHRGENLGFEVDRVLRVVKLAAGAVEPHPVAHTSEADESIRGVFRHNGALTILLDLDKLLDSSHAPDKERLVSRL